MTQTVSLTLYPTFVRSRFPNTRQILAGKKRKFGLIFQAPPQAQTQASPQILSGQPAVGSQTIPTFQVENRTSKSKFLQLPPVEAKPLPTKSLASKPVLSKRLVQVLLSLVSFISIVVFLIVITPALYYRLFPVDVQPIQATNEGTPLGGDFDQGATTPLPSATPRPLPPQDSSLPEGTWLIVPRIGIRTQPQATQDPEEALLNGVWLVPDFGRPGDTSQPIIMAAHRYGWQWWWQTDYWKYHSFYLLPELEPGDIVEVIDDQRKYYFEIYAGEEGEEITDYSADLILYTCKFLNSPVRHFRYARWVDMDKDTQVG